MVINYRRKDSLIERKTIGLLLNYKRKESESQTRLTVRQKRGKKREISLERVKKEEEEMSIPFRRIQITICR